jgi:transcriptional regulator with XRE-family HTH domain
MTPAISESLDAILKREYLRKQVRHCEVCVKLIRERHGVTQQEIEDALGITRSYLSHLLAGSKEASLQMVRQLTAFAVSPEAFEAAMSIVFIDGPAEIFAGLFAVATCRRFPQRVDGFAKPGAYRNNWTPQKGANGHGKHTGT